MNRRSRIEHVTLAAAVSTLALGSCARAPVMWSEVTYAAPPRPAIQLGRVMPPTGGCPVSTRSVRRGEVTFGVWWSVRRDSSALLVVGQSRDGGRSWTSQVVADSTDRSVRGCGRPAPAIAVDSATNYVHLAYFAEPPSRSGIFFAHSMDGGRTFHAAVPIVFGENSAFVGVAASGDRVAVAY
ncbi:MAG: glycoside hydrolase, partial [Acidobacteriota bacterium]|nr:glycoside hydrolase [Acidobacteriota bacterium]